MPTTEFQHSVSLDQVCDPDAFRDLATAVDRQWMGETCPILEPVPLTQSER